MHHVGSDNPEDNHHKVDEVMSDGCTILSPTEGGDDEEDGDPNNDLVPHEHPSRA